MAKNTTNDSSANGSKTPNGKAPPGLGSNRTAKNGHGVQTSAGNDGAVSPDNFLEKYPVTFIEPAADDAFVRNCLGAQNAEKLVQERAETDFDKHNPSTNDGLKERRVRLKEEISFHEKEKLKALKARGDEPAYEEVTVKNTKVEDQFLGRAFYASLLSLLAGGFFMLTSTIAVTITQSDKVPLAYEYPYIAVLFAFLPLGGMWLASITYAEIKTTPKKSGFVWSIYALTGILTLIWVATFQPAYAEPDFDFEDLSAAAGFDFFPLHITMQLLGELFLGGSIKVSLQRRKEKILKTVARPLTGHKVYTKTARKMDKQLAPLLAESLAIERHLNAREAARNSYVNAQLGKLAKFQNDAKQADEVLKTAVAQAGAAKKLEIMKAQGEENH